jgi:putative transposase
MFFWHQQTKVRLHYNQPGKSTKNAFVEPSNDRLRNGRLDQQWFRDPADARRTSGTAVSITMKFGHTAH